MEKLKIESADVRVSNSNETDRIYKIAGTAHIINGIVKCINNGNIQAVDNGSMLASFDSQDANHLGIQFQTEESRTDILSEIEAFVKKCRTSEELEISISE